MAGRCARSRSRPTAAGDLRQLRHLGDPLVAAAQRRRAGAALPRRRGQRGRVLKDGRIATSGEDGRIAIWRPGERSPTRAGRPQGAGGGARGLARRRNARLRVVGPHRAAVAARRRRAARARRPHAERQRRRLHARRPRVVSAGYDATVRIWPLGGGGAPVIATLPTPLNAVAVAPDGEIVTAGADGKVYFLSPRASSSGEVEAAGPTPIIAVAISPDGTLHRRRRHPRLGRDHRPRRAQARAHAGRTRPAGLVGRVLPDSRTLLTGGTDRMIRRWDAVTGEPIGAVAMGAPRIRSPPMPAIPAPRSSAPASPATRSRRRGHRAGPTLAGIFGRRIATLPGLQFLRGAEEARHRLDAGDGVEAVRGRTHGLYARHQDAGAAHRLAPR